MSLHQGPTFFNSLTGGTQISGGTFILNCRPQKTTSTETTLLEHHVVQSATHDTNEIPNPPQCHPGTRVALLKRLSNWVKATNSQTRITWLFGPAGAGKSAISQSLAEELTVAQHLIASFFFSRTDPRRNTDKPLVATIAYQFACHRPIRKHITATVRDDPLIFYRSLKAQFERLIVDPVNDLFSAPALILIDGLDECEGREVRKLILNTIFHFLPRLGTNIKFLITSRPEDDFQQIFGRANNKQLVNFVELHSDSQAHGDIQFYLHSVLSQLKTTHPIGETLDSEWPSSQAINDLVQKSSGHFIYAHTILKYIDSHHHPPQNCLDFILSSHATTECNPYSELDVLYHDVLSSSRADRNTLTQVLSFALICIRAGEPLARLDIFIESLLSFERGTVKLALSDLCSVISSQKRPLSSGSPTWSIKFEHESFVDFLLNSSRSREFHIDLERTCMSVAKACLKALGDRAHLAKCWPINTEQRHAVDLKSIRSSYLHVVLWCCRHIPTDPELQSRLLDYEPP